MTNIERILVEKIRSLIDERVVGLKHFIKLNPRTFDVLKRHHDDTGVFMYDPHNRLMGIFPYELDTSMEDWEIVLCHSK